MKPIASLVLCLTLPLAALADDQVSADLLIYRVEEPGVGFLPSRVLVTPAALRLDQGADEAAFLLFDRKAGVIYSVIPEDRSILVIQPPADAPVVPPGLALEFRELPMPDAPPVANRSPVHWRLLVNSQPCGEFVTVPGLLPEAGVAMAEYREALARQESATSDMGIGQADACELAIAVHSAGWEYRKGLVLQSWGAKVQRRQLEDFRPGQAVSAQLFRLPQDYKRLSLGGVTKLAPPQ